MHHMICSHSSSSCLRDITKINLFRQINRHSWNVIFWHNNWHNDTFWGFLKNRGLVALCGFCYVGLFKISISCTRHRHVYEMFMPETLSQKELHGRSFYLTFAEFFRIAFIESTSGRMLLRVSLFLQEKY